MFVFSYEERVNEGEKMLADTFRQSDFLHKLIHPNVYLPRWKNSYAIL